MATVGGVVLGLGLAALICRAVMGYLNSLPQTRGGVTVVCPSCGKVNVLPLEAFQMPATATSSTFCEYCGSALEGDAPNLLVALKADQR